MELELCDGIGISNQQNPSYLYQSVSNTTNYNKPIITNCMVVKIQIIILLRLILTYCQFYNNIACFGNPQNLLI